MTKVGTYHGPIPHWVTKVLQEAGHNNENHRDLYLAGLSQYNGFLECMSLTTRGANYHVNLMMQKIHT